MKVRMRHMCREKRKVVSVQKTTFNPKLVLNKRSFFLPLISHDIGIARLSWSIFSNLTGAKIRLPQTSLCLPPSPLPFHTFTCFPFSPLPTNLDSSLKPSLMGNTMRQATRFVSWHFAQDCDSLVRGVCRRYFLDEFEMKSNESWITQQEKSRKKFEDQHQTHLVDPHGDFYHWRRNHCGECTLQDLQRLLQKSAFFWHGEEITQTMRTNKLR